MVHYEYTYFNHSHSFEFCFTIEISEAKFNAKKIIKSLQSRQDQEASIY